MTEVDTVMLEGGAPLSASSRQITAVAESSSPSSVNDQTESDAVVAIKNVESGSTLTGNHAMKITESTATSTTTTKTIAAPSTCHDVENFVKSSTDKSHTSMDVDEDDCGGAVTTTTTEQECEDDSQVTSSSADIDGQTENSKQESADANPSPSPTLQLSDAAAENSSSQTVDGNDYADDCEAEAETEAATASKDVDSQISNPSPSSNAKSEVTDSVCDKSQDSDTVNNGPELGGSKERSKDEISDMEDENSAQSAQLQKPNNVDDGKEEVDASNVKPHLVKSPTGACQKHNAQKATASPIDLVDRMDVSDDVDPLSVDNEMSPMVVNSFEAKNGVAKNTANNGAVVDLDSDDDENCDDAESNGGKRKEQSNGSKSLRNTAMNSNKIRSACSDSDGAVVIGSDSENEVNNSPKDARNNNKGTPTSAPINESDDDDDCVVIEDDSPLELTPKNDQMRRKSVVLDSENNSDDSQPPSKRQRRLVGNQLTIKDPRSLLPTESLPSTPTGNGKKAPSVSDSGVYPVNITPAGGNMLTPTGPPKLAPIGGGATISAGSGTVGTLPGLVGVNSNANLLPGLTDDMFVLEAPSFIVPYIYEKPPSDNLREIVKEIETKYELTKEDLTEADKSDEFDMMTEQNKEDRDPQASQGKKKKKRRYDPDVDDSWSEESEEDDEDDEDDDSEAGVRTKVLIKEASDDLAALKGAIKPAAAVTQSITASAPNVPVKPGQENYFESPLGKFFMDIGVGLVQEFVQTDLIRLQKRKMRKSLGKNLGDFERAIAALSGNLEASKKKNSAFKFTTKRCEFCNFKSESALAMAHHYETPHMNGPLYKCNFCTFEIRNATEIVYHMEAMHNIKARLIKPLPYHQCPNCGFEDNGKAKLARHQPVCAKKFRPELNLAPPNDWEAPAKIPRIKPRHGLVGTATAYQAMAAQAAAQKAALATIQQQQQQQQARNLQAAALAAQNAVNKIRGRPPVLSKVGGAVGPNGTASLLRGTNPTGPRAMATNVVLPNNYQLPGNQIIPATNALHTGKKTSMPGQPSISITPLPRQSATPQTASPSTSKLPPAGSKPGKPPTGSKAQFVICEICDGYIKDLEQLRNHMQWMHEVKIHPKMIYNRPPLNCQKCQFRFFTDQGLERHLLGSHGLVTSSMQEAANKGKDAGRCPVCGRMYQWKLLNHVARDHHMTLKPAHLSYKCTVCTATFGMYKQFETHVYTAHSTVAKKAMDSKKNSAAAASGGNANAGSGASAASSSGARGGNLSTAASNDSLLKPLKINDEITIIPQPASKPRITNMESHVID